VPTSKRRLKPVAIDSRKIRIAFGQELRTRREARSFTQESLATESGLDRTFISQIERGIRQPTVLSLCRLAIALDTTVAELVMSIDRTVASG
jgi:transcriptional regulator with XRE-family HTH domain